MPEPAKPPTVEHTDLPQPPSDEHPITPPPSSQDEGYNHGVDIEFMIVTLRVPVLVENLPDAGTSETGASEATAPRGKTT